MVNNRFDSYNGKSNRTKSRRQSDRNAGNKHNRNNGGVIKQTAKVMNIKKRSNVALIMFAIVMFYVVCFVALYLSKSKVQIYEVEMGSINTNLNFLGVAARNEQVYYSNYSGNINYYQREGNRIHAQRTVCTVDETGRVSDILAQYSSGDNSLSTNDLRDLKNTLSQYKRGYDSNNFSELYGLKADLNSTVLQAINENIMSNLGSIVQDTGSASLFQSINSDVSGIVVYSTDGYEKLNDDTISQNVFNKSEYSKQSIKSGSVVVANSPVFKIINDENWYIYFKLDEKTINDNRLKTDTFVKIKFSKDGIQTRGRLSIFSKDGVTYGKIYLDKYMVKYATERYVDFEIENTGASGIKIPVSSVTTSDFYKIPIQYLTKIDGQYGFMVGTATYMENSTFTLIDYYMLKNDKENVYVKKSDIEPGTILLMNHSNPNIGSDTVVTKVVTTESEVPYIASATVQLQGVYSVNTGYTYFKLVEVIDENKEYYIIRSNTDHGLSVYDRIVINADKYKENEMVY